jgi:two-component system, OmpR family, copper resistance phosphate regulon response regulator CusR
MQKEGERNLTFDSPSRYHGNAEWCGYAPHQTGMSSVLIAEGEPRIASFVKHGLDANGFVTSVATSADEAIALSRRVRFDLVVLDAALVGLKPTLVQDLRGDEPHTPVLLLTKQDLIEASTDPHGVPADDYLRKPFRFSELLARVSRRIRPSAPAAPTVLHRHGATFERRTRRLTLEGRTLELTPREAALVDLIFRDSEGELTSEQLLGRLRSL